MDQQDQDDLRENYNNGPALSMIFENHVTALQKKYRKTSKDYSLQT
jgi:hypothetical protein